MHRDLGIVALISSAALLVMGALVLLVPEPSIGLGIIFLAIGLALVALGVWGVTRPAGEAQQRAPAGPSGPPDDRSKSRLRQVLDGLYFFG